MSKQQNLEEIVMVVENVKNKKIEGALYLMSERIAWMPKQKSVFTVSHHYVDIKTQKISTEGKSKIQLQVVLHDDTSSTFHFIAPAGAAAQTKDRDKVKDLLANLLPKFKQKISEELEEKKKILIENPQVYQLYNDLVVAGVVSAEDFWKNYVDFEEFNSESKNQTTGIAQGFMSHINPKSDGSNGLVYHISLDDIQSIFKTYPAVKQKYTQNVPHKMTEKDFWSKFFQSYYFRRDQINTTTTDLFADCAIKEDDELKKKAAKLLVNPTDVIESQKEILNEDGFGLTDFVSNKSSNLSNQNLIKRYNYYSMRVLSAMEESSSTDPKLKKQKAVPTTRIPAKKVRLDEEIEDLEKFHLHDLRGAQLNLKHVDRYFRGLKSGANKTSASDLALIAHDPKILSQKTLNEVFNWNMDVKKIANPSLAISILVDLSPGSQLMQKDGIQNLKEEIPKRNQEEVKALYISSCEMLRHFWACFPPKNEQLENKLKLMKETLECFYQQKIISLHDRLNKEDFAWNLTSHLENMFQIAFLKYNTWKTKTSA